GITRPLSARWDFASSTTSLSPRGTLKTNTRRSSEWLSLTGTSIMGMERREFSTPILVFSFFPCISIRGIRERGLGERQGREGALGPLLRFQFGHLQTQATSDRHSNLRSARSRRK